MTERKFTPDVFLTLLATTDIHGHLYDWDYYRDAPFAQPLGLSRLASIIADVRAQRGADTVVCVDNGDFLEGNPLTSLAAKGQLGAVNPMVHAYNLIAYDAVTTGNHEYNYGLDYLGAIAGGLTAPLLAANAIDRSTGHARFGRSTLVAKRVGGHQVRVGIVGVTTVGSSVWDRTLLGDHLDFVDPVATAHQEVTRLRTDGADVVIVCAHSGHDVLGSQPMVGNLHENVATSLAEQVPGVDVVVCGHSHQDITETVVTGAAGHPVLITQPAHWAQAVAEVTIALRDDSGRLAVDHQHIRAQQLWAADAGEAWSSDDTLMAAHKRTQRYMDTVVATSQRELVATECTITDSPIMDFLAETLAAEADEHLSDGASELPLLVAVASFSRGARVPQGSVRVKDIADLYVHDSTLVAIEITGAQLADYLEYSAKYFQQVAPGTVIDPVAHTNAVYEGRPVPDYHYDMLTGVDYTIDVAKPVGERIVSLTRAGQPVDSDERFALVINRYRHCGGGNFPHVRTAPVVWEGNRLVPDVLIDRTTSCGSIDPADFHTVNWHVVASAGRRSSPSPSS